MYYESEFDRNLWERRRICTEAIREESAQSRDPNILNSRYNALRARVMQLGKDYTTRLPPEKREWYGGKARILTDLLRQTEELLTEFPQNKLKIIVNLGEVATRIMGIEYELLMVA